MKFQDGKSSTIKGMGKSVHIYADGHRMCKRALLPQDSSGQATCVRTSKNTKRPFTFADIRTTGTDTLLPLGPNHPVLFTLHYRVTQMKTHHLTMPV